MLWIRVVDNDHICCGTRCPFMLWVYVVDDIDMLWICVVDDDPQYILHNIYFVIHNMYSTTYTFLYIVGVCCGWHRYVVDYMFLNDVHNISTLSTRYICCGRRLSFCSLVAHNIHPQYITVSTTYTHKIYILISCGCMLWITSTYVVDHVCYTYVVDCFEFYRCIIIANLLVE